MSKLKCKDDEYTSQFFVDARNRESALKKARKEIHTKYPQGTAHMFSLTQQEFKKGRFVAWVCVRGTRGK